MTTFESEVATTAGESAVAHKVTTRAIASWVLYDLANTVFSMGVVSLYFPQLVRAEVGADRADFVYGLVSALSMSVMFVMSPLLGSMTDRARRRMPFLVTSTTICVFFTVILARSGFTMAAACFVIANIAYQAGLQFYDAMLPEVSTEENRGKIGGIGVGVGYLGSFVAVGLGFAIKDDPSLLFTALAGVFLVFALPCFLFVKERGNPHPTPFSARAVIDATRETIRTLRTSDEFPGLARFLVGRVFYTDAINTVISIMALYTINVAVSTGLSEEQGRAQSQLIMLTAISFAVLGGFVWGAMADRRGPKKTLNWVLRAWMAIFTMAALVGILGLPLWSLYIVACSAGFSLGGIWAADRPYMLRLTPPSRVGEFYGLYGMVGRFSAITGPLIWAGMAFLTITTLRMSPEKGQGFGVLALLVLVFIGYTILQKVDDTPRKWN
jgi:MFS transporter, UMF1 family